MIIQTTITCGGDGGGGAPCRVDSISKCAEIDVTKCDEKMVRDRLTTSKYTKCAPKLP